MKPLFNIFIFSLLLFSTSIAYAAKPTPGEMAMVSDWLENTFPGNPPFSFIYNDVYSNELLPNWQLTQTEDLLDANRTKKTFIYLDPATHLQVRCVATVYSDYPAVEWVLYFRNDGNADTPIIRSLNALDMTMNSPGETTGDFVLYYSHGSTASVSDFEPVRQEIAPNQHLSFAPNGGRSSDGVLPFFNVEQADRTGHVFAIGWTGQWAAMFARDDGDNLNIAAGMERTHLRLHPGEEIRTPRILLLFWEKDRMRGHNLLRSLVLDHYTLTPGDKPLVPPLCAGNSGVIGFNNTTESNQIEAVNDFASHNIPIDTWWLDAGWSTGGFPAGMGTWQPDPSRFPNGMKPVADAVHSHNMKFLLWFEPERVMPGSWLYNNHPDWLLRPSGLPDALAYQKNWRLLNLGNTEALNWAKTYFSDMIRDSGIDIYRQDFNMHPLYYWGTAEANDRRGINEIKHITGLYDYLDYLLQQHPALIIDNCASGGRRLDLEMTKRSIPLWRSDHCWDPISDQSQTYGISFWLPLSGMGVNATNSTYKFRSAMGPNFVLAYDFFNAGTPWGWFREMLNQLKKVRKYFYGDYYPLTFYSTQNNVWMAYQFNRPDSTDGMVVAFRRKNAASQEQSFQLHGLDPELTYRVLNMDEGRAEFSTGQALMQNGLKIELNDSPKSALFIYEKQSTSQVFDTHPVSHFVLHQNYPNPFNPTTTINYRLPSAAKVELTIYNLSGQKIATLVSTKQIAGFHKAKWNAADFASGIYFYRIDAGTFHQIKKMALVK